MSRINFSSNITECVGQNFSPYIVNAHFLLTFCSIFFIVELHGVWHRPTYFYEEDVFQRDTRCKQISFYVSIWENFRGEIGSKTFLHFGYIFQGKRFLSIIFNCSLLPLLICIIFNHWSFKVLSRIFFVKFEFFSNQIKFLITKFLTFRTNFMLRFISFFGFVSRCFKNTNWGNFMS